MERFNLFAAPVFVYDVDEMEAVNEELALRLVEESQSTDGLHQSNIGGWHSPPDLSQRPEPCYKRVIQEVVDRVGHTFGETCAAAGIQLAPSLYRYAVHAWAMVMRDGDYTILHDHAEAHWSLAYYVDAGDSDAERYPNSGDLSFVDPGRGSTTIPGANLFPSTFTVKARTGAMVIFPSWLQHYVHPYRGTRPRVCISCNVKMVPAQ
jgi:uncharacterized protein (TIGR02466 family)